MSNDESRPSYILSVLGNKCPRCREGDLFLSKNAYALRKNKFIKMHDYCPVCGQPTDIEVGFYYGTGYVSYALTVVISLITFFAWWVLIGISIMDNSIYYWLGVNSFLLLVLQPVLMRISRTLWLSWFVKYDPHWRNNKVENAERVVKEHMGNW